MRKYHLLDRLINMNKTISRRTFLKKSIASLLTITGLGIGGKYYIHNIEPHWLKTNHIPISHSFIPKGFHGLKMVQFSDTHLGFQFQLKDLQTLIQKINALQADVIIFTGDLMDKPDKYRNYKEIIPVLQKLHAPLGKFCVYGNHDHGGYGSEIYKSIMEMCEFTLLQNANIELSLLSKESIYLTGIDDAMLGQPDFPEALSGIPESKYTILLSHAPDLADTAKNYPIHLQISGHSHGGQVQIPFFGALVTPPFAERYPEGLYNIDSLTLYVNRGIGTTRLPYRFLSRPEITVYELHSPHI